MKEARIGSHCNLGEHVFVENGASVGDRVTVKNGVSIWTKVQIDDDAFIGPAAVFTNDLKPRAFVKRGPEVLIGTRVGKGATVGAGTVIVSGVTIGPYAFIGAGSVVTRDIPAHGYVKGNPARLSGFACRCAETFFRLGTTDGKCPTCGHANPQSANKQG